MDLFGIKRRKQYEETVDRLAMFVAVLCSVLGLSGEDIKNLADTLLKGDNSRFAIVPKGMYGTLYTDALNRIFALTKVVGAMNGILGSHISGKEIAEADERLLATFAKTLASGHTEQVH